MDKSAFYIILISVLCTSLDLRQVDFEDIFNQHNEQQATTASGATTTTSSPLYENCFSNCLQYVTSQYNPVCGSNGQSYNNPKTLECAQRCGLSVTFESIGTCGPSPGGK